MSVLENIVGVINAEGPPVAIPNTEVKLCRADDTWLATARENRYAPTWSITVSVVLFFYLKIRTDQDNRTHELPMLIFSMGFFHSKNEVFYKNSQIVNTWFTQHKPMYGIIESRFNEYRPNRRNDMKYIFLIIMLLFAFASCRPQEGSAAPVETMMAGKVTLSN